MEQSENSPNTEAIQNTIKDKILAYLKSKGEEVENLPTDEDLVASGKLDSFDSVSVIAELEETFGKMANFSDESKEGFKMTVAWLTKVFS